MPCPQNIRFRRPLLLVQFHWTTIEDGRVEDLFEFGEINMFLFSRRRRDTSIVPATVKQFSSDASMFEIRSLRTVIDSQRTILDDARWRTTGIDWIRCGRMIVGQRVIDLRARYQQASIFPFLPRLNTRRRSKILNYWRSSEKRIIPIGTQASECQSTHARRWMSLFSQPSMIRARWESNHSCSMLISSVNETKWKMIRPFVFLASLFLFRSEWKCKKRIIKTSEICKSAFLLLFLCSIRNRDDPRRHKRIHSNEFQSTIHHLAVQIWSTSNSICCSRPGSLLYTETRSK